MSWEIPGGKVDPDESLEAAAGRELLEETGYSAQNLSPLFSYDVGLDTRYNPTNLFETTDIELTNSLDNETVEIKWMPFSDCMDLVMDGSITDIFTITAIFAHQLLTLDGRIYSSQR